MADTDGPKTDPTPVKIPSKTLIEVGPGQTPIQEPEYVAVAPSGNTLFSKVPRYLDNILEPWMGNKACQRMFRSTDAIWQEKARHKRENRFIIHPFCIFRWYWDMIMVVTLVITLVTLPVEIAFYANDVHPQVHWFAIHVLADVIFLADLILNFRTGYIHTDDGEVVLTTKRIICHYLKSWFFIDLISSLPFDNLYIMFSGVPEGADSDSILLTLRVLRLTKLLRLLRILRVARLVRYVHKMEELLEVEAKVISIFNLVMMIFVLCHWNACVQYLVSYIENYPDFDPDCWIFLDNIHTDNVTVDMKYSRSLWRAMSHMLSIGFGATPPRGSLLETWMVIISMTLGATCYALFVAHCSGLIMTLDSSGRRYEEKVSEVRQYMRFRRVPIDIQKRVVEYYDHKYQRKFFDENSLLHEHHISGPLKQEIVLHNCKSLVEKVPFLANAPGDFLFEIICKLQFQVFFPGETIVHAGKKGDSMYFIEHGKVEILLPSGQVVNTLSDGAYFGEISLMLEERRVASVVAVEICDMYTLFRKDFDEVLEDFPRMKAVLRHIALERLAALNKESTEGDVAELLARESENKFKSWTRSVMNLDSSGSSTKEKGADAKGGPHLAFPTAVPAIVIPPDKSEEVLEVILPK